MNPDIELQLQGVIKALSEVVAPALDATNKSAMEQLHLSIATLGLLRERVEHQSGRVRAELAHAIALGERLDALGVMGDEQAALAEAVRLRADPDAALGDIRAATARLLAAAADAIDSVEAPALAAQVCRETIIASKAQTDLARAWFVRSGFELEPDKVPDLASLLAAGRG